MKHIPPLLSGFQAVECHWPYATPASEVRSALEAAGLLMVSINTRQGINGPADFGVNAMPGRAEEARGYIDEALYYAHEIGALCVNAPAGKTGGTPAAEAVYRENLEYACGRAARHGITMLVEPINHRDAPGYHVSRVGQAIETICAVGAPNLRLLFDVYHVQMEEGDAIRLVVDSMPYIGHIQFAGVPFRREPDEGDLDYKAIFTAIDAAGWTGFVGAEYRPRAATEEGLGWLRAFAQSPRPEAGVAE